MTVKLDQRRLAPFTVCALLTAIMGSPGCQHREAGTSARDFNKGNSLDTSSDKLSVTPPPIPQTPAYIRGTNDPQLIVFLELLKGMDAIENVRPLIHPRCLPALEDEVQRKDCDNRLRNSIQHAPEDILVVSTYDRSRALWQPDQYATVVEPELVVTVDPDWNHADYPFQDGFTKWLLAKSDGDWRIVMPAVNEQTLADDAK